MINKVGKPNNILKSDLTPSTPKVKFNLSNSRDRSLQRTDNRKNLHQVKSEKLKADSSTTRNKNLQRTITRENLHQVNQVNPEKLKKANSDRNFSIKTNEEEVKISPRKKPKKRGEINSNKHHTGTAITKSTWKKSKKEGLRPTNQHSTIEVGKIRTTKISATKNDDLVVIVSPHGEKWWNEIYYDESSSDEEKKEEIAKNKHITETAIKNSPWKESVTLAYTAKKNFSMTIGLQGNKIEKKNNEVVEEKRKNKIPSSVFLPHNKSEKISTDDLWEKEIKDTFDLINSHPIGHQLLSND